MTDYPALRELFGGYLNLDWYDEYGDLWPAVDDFTAHEPIAAELPTEVEMLLSAGHDESSLESIVLDDMGTGYLPVPGETTIAAWLTDIGRHVRATLDAQHGE